MNFRLAVMQDLPRLKAMYEDIIQNMNNNQIQIWDDIYPCEFFDEILKITAFMFCTVMKNLFRHLSCVIQI